MAFPASGVELLAKANHVRGGGGAVNRTATVRVIAAG